MPRITKAQRQRNLTNELLLKTLMAVGLYMSNNYIFDQDSGLPWMFKNKMVKYPYNSPNISLHCNEVIFNPLLSKAMVKDLSDIGIAKAIRFDDLYVKALAPEILENGNKKLVLYTNDDVITTNTYKHEIMIYYDMAFLLADMMTEENKNLLRDIDEMLVDIVSKRKINHRKKVFSDVIYD